MCVSCVPKMAVMPRLLLLLLGVGGRWARGLGLDELPADVVRGQVLFMRHALAPGGGDPVGFQVEECATQRNLGPSGRDQATRIGADMRGVGLRFSAVYASPWCRCLDTARLMDVGPVRSMAALGSFYQAPPIGVERGPALDALHGHLATVDPDQPPQLMVRARAPGTPTRAARPRPSPAKGRHPPATHARPPHTHACARDPAHPRPQR